MIIACMEMPDNDKSAHWNIWSAIALGRIEDLPRPVRHEVIGSALRRSFEPPPPRLSDDWQALLDKLE